MGQEPFGSTKMTTRGVAKAKNAIKEGADGPKRRPRESKREENRTGAPLFGDSGGPEIGENLYICRDMPDNNKL